VKFWLTIGAMLGHTIDNWAIFSHSLC